MVFRNHLTKQRVPKMTPGIRNKINKALSYYLKQAYFKSIPLTNIFNILMDHDVVVLQEDNTEWSGFLVGGVKKTEQVYFTLGWLNTRNSDHSLNVYDIISNATLALSYYKMPNTGNYEIISYIT